MNNAEDHQLTLLPLEQRHVSAIAAIEADAAFMPWSAELLAQCVRPDYVNSVAISGEEVVGYSICSTGADEAHLQNIVVAVEHQGKGWGHWLLEQTVNVLSQQSLNRLFLEVRASNAAAIGLYQRFGFENIGLRKDYYEAPVGREDAYVYVLEL